MVREREKKHTTRVSLQFMTNKTLQWQKITNSTRTCFFPFFLFFFSHPLRGFTFLSVHFYLFINFFSPLFPRGNTNNAAKTRGQKIKKGSPKREGALLFFFFRCSSPASEHHRRAEHALQYHYTYNIIFRKPHRVSCTRVVRRVK
jgi:hypothetical protein